MRHVCSCPLTTLLQLLGQLRCGKPFARVTARMWKHTWLDSQTSGCHC